MSGPNRAKYTCGNCYTEFDLPDDGRCPTCKVREIVPMSDKKDLNVLREQWAEHVFLGAREEVLYIIDRALTAENERDSLIQALRDGFADDVQHPTKADLLYWITSTCPWLENKFDVDIDPLPEITYQHTGEMAPTVIGYTPTYLNMSEVDENE